MLSSVTTYGESRNMIVEDSAIAYPAAMAASRVAKSSTTFQRNTQQRREIRDVFQHNDRPLAAEEVLDLAQQKVTGLGMATVYRTIKALTDEGWLLRVEVPGAPPRYEMRGKAHHHHFHCLKCGKLFELEGCLERLGNLIPPSFRVVDHVVLLYGYCATCDRTRKGRVAATSRNHASKR
jgi:Fur family transcriptional regulator, ferric uptake regulator